MPTQLLAIADDIDVLRGRALQVEELVGGLTNKNYRVRTDDGGDYVVRIYEPTTGLLAINRENERANTVTAWHAGVGAPVVAAVPERNALVVQFLTGRTLEATDVQDPAMIPRIASSLQMLHTGGEFQGVFDMRTIRRYYLSVVMDRGFRLPDDYLELMPAVEQLEEAMRPGNESLVPCNNDLLAANFIDDGERVWVIDYEYSGMNEASFELGNVASESGLDDEATAWLAECYWGERLPHKVARAQAWSLLARYGWTLWASIQDGSSSIDFDFWSWGMAKYESARTELTGPRLPQIISALDVP